MNKSSSKEYLFLEFDKALKYGRKFAITSLAAMIGFFLWIVLLIVMLGFTFSSISNSSDNSGLAGGWILWGLMLIVIGAVAVAGLVYNVLASIKYGNVFSLINPSSSTVEDEADIKNNPEIVLTVKNIKNCLLAHLIISILGGIFVWIFLLIGLAAAVISIVMVALVWKYNNKLMEWRKTRTIDRTE